MNGASAIVQDVWLLSCFVSFRKTPPYGRDTIRVFRRNVSDLKGFAARDYEDVLQVRSTSFNCTSEP